MKRTLLKLHLFMLVILLLNACGNVEKILHIEVFVAETPGQGFKKVNSISTIEKGKNYLKADTKAIEDFYDLDGNYLKTEIIHSNGNKTYLSPAINGDIQKIELQEPSTILIPDRDIRNFKLFHLTKDEEEKVKEHILSFMDLL